MLFCIHLLFINDFLNLKAMNHLTILKTEVILQTIFSIVLIILCTYNSIFSGKQDLNFTFLFGILLIGIFNFLGYLLIRSEYIISNFNNFYFWGVILIFLIFAVLLLIDTSIAFLIAIFLGSLFNIYYIIYGFILIKNWHKKSIS